MSQTWSQEEIVALITPIVEAYLIANPPSGAGDFVKATDDTDDITEGAVKKFVTTAEKDAWNTGSDPWTYVVLPTDFVTSSASAVDVIDFLFTPQANTQYEFEAELLVQTTTTTVGARPGLSWATGLTEGAVRLFTPSSATANLQTNGTKEAAVLAAVGGLPVANRSYLATMKGMIIAGATPSGNVQVRLAAETAGTNVTIKAGSFIKYRTY